MARDIRVERTENHTHEISIYDRYGSGGLELTGGEALFIRDRLCEIFGRPERGEYNG